MASYRLRRGLHLRMHGKGDFSIEQRLPNGELQLKNVATNECIAIKESDLIQALFDGGLELLGAEQNHPLSDSRTSQQLISDLSLLSDNLKRETKRRFAYINEVISQGVTSLTQHNLAPVIEKVKREIDDLFPPAWLTLYRWSKRYLASGRDVRSIVPAHKRRGNHRRKFSGGNAEKAEATIRIIEEVITKPLCTESA